MNFIKKIFDEKIDDSVHLQFQKFSRGEFTNRALVRIKKVKDKFTITTSAEFGNELVRDMAEKLGNEKAKVTGVVVTTSDLTGKLEFERKKQFQGVKQYVMNKEMTGKELLSVLNEFPKSFFGLSFEFGDEKLKIKAKAPKSGKPGSKGEDAPRADFCRLVTMDRSIGEGFVFEKKDFKDAEVNHTFMINEIVVPEELKKSEDFARIREESRRKGKIIRSAMIDDKRINSEKAFEA